MPWILAVVFLLLFVVGSASDAFVFATLALIVTGIFHLLRGRSWVTRLTRTKGRRVAAVPLLASVLAVMLVGVTAETTEDTIAAEPAPTAASTSATATISQSPTATPSAPRTTDAPASRSPSPTPSPTVSPTPTPVTTTVEPEPTPTTEAPPTTEAGDGGQASALLAELPIKGRAPKTGYDRDQFGQRWADIDRNGCDQRNGLFTEVSGSGV